VRVLRSPLSAPDPEGLLDSAEEQLDRPATFVECGDLAGRRIQIIAHDAQNLAGVQHNRDSFGHDPGTGQPWAKPGHDDWGPPERQSKHLFRTGPLDRMFACDRGDPSHSMQASRVVPDGPAPSLMHRETGRPYTGEHLV
jgi:hypothetical protein